MGDSWRYHLDLLPLSDDGEADPGAHKPPPEDAGWQLVSAKVAEDGRTEQRVYRRPA